MGSRDLKVVADIEQLRTIRTFDPEKVVVARRDGNGYLATYDRIEDGSFGGTDDGDFEIIGNDGYTFWRKRA